MALEAIFVKQSVISLKSYEDKNQLVKNKQFQKKIKVIFHFVLLAHYQTFLN